MNTTIYNLIPLIFQMLLVYSCLYKILKLTEKVRYLEIDLQVHQDFTRKYIIDHELAIERLQNSVNKNIPVDDIKYPINTKVAQDIQYEIERMSK